MQKKIRKNGWSRFVAAALALVMVLSNVPAAFAADSVLPDDYRGLKSAQPDLKGYRIQEILSWDPATDPYADYLKASVPLQQRNELFQPTQADPVLDGKAQVMLMQGDYGNAFFESPLYNNDFSNLCMNFWQYTDYFCPWHGAVPYDTPESFYDSPKDSWWTSRGFEFGIVNLPTAAYTNAAHKNGAKSIACIYFDPTGRPGQTCSDMFVRDAENGFPVAQKMIDIAKYYGFDGYFFNNEENTDQSFKDFMQVIRDAGLYAQYYNTSNSFTGKMDWLGTPDNRYCDSVFVNYGWPWSVDSDKAEFAKGTWDPYEVAFYGVESNQGKLNGEHSSEGEVPKLYRDQATDHNPIGSIALFTPSDYYHRGLTDNLGWTGPWSGESPNQNPDYQWMIAERERMYFSGPKIDPTNTGKTTVSRPDIALPNAGGWVGVADFISERSVIGGSAFYSNFNTGHGMQYFVDGAVSTDEEWTNMNLQDILPTWQWWIDSTGTRKLSADFDYGVKETRVDTQGEPLVLPYTQVGAYEGGSSLVLYGELDGKNTMHLFKTDLAVNDNSQLAVTYQKAAGETPAKIGLVMKDAPDVVEELTLPSSASVGGWVTDTLPLADYAGRQIAAIYVIADGTEAAFQLNLGSIRVLDGQDHTPAAPTGLTLKNVFSDGQLELRWNLSDYDTVKQYNVYLVDAQGNRSFAGGLYGDAFYVKNAPVTGNVTVELTAIGADGSESEAASVSYNFDKAVSGISVPQARQVNPGNEKSAQTANAEEGVVDAHWTAPVSAGVDHYDLTVSLINYGRTYSGEQVFKATAPADATSFKVPVPVYERYDYLLEIAAVYTDGTVGEPICYQGKLKDTYAAPMELENFHLNSEGTVVYYDTPALMDWYRVHLAINGVEADFRQRATSGARSGWRVEQGNLLTFTMEDYLGNQSEPLKLLVNNGVLEIPVGLLDETDFPDAALLQAVVQQVGPTRKDLTRYVGALDLSGLQIADLTGLEKVVGLTSIKFNDNTALTALDRTTFAAMEKLTALELTGCTALTSLQLNDLTLEQLVLSGTYEALTSANLSGNRFDFSEGTPERQSLELLLTTAPETKFGGQHPVPYSKVLFLDGRTENLPQGAGTKDLNDYAKPIVSLYDNDFAGLADVRINGAGFTAADYADVLPDFVWDVRAVADGEVFGASIDTTVSRTYKVSYIDPETQKTVSVLTVVVGIGSPESHNLLLDEGNSKGFIIGITNMDGEGNYYNRCHINDGKYDTMWNPGYGSDWSGYPESFVAVDLKQEQTITKWVLVNSGYSEGETYYNTADCDLEVLDTSKITVEELLALEGADLQNKLADNSIWTVIASVRDNAENMVTQEFMPLTNGRIFRLHITKPQLDSWLPTPYVAELELHGYSYIAPVDPTDPEALKNAALAAEAAAEAAQAAAEEAQRKAEDARAAAEAAIASTAADKAAAEEAQRKAEAAQAAAEEARTAAEAAQTAAQEAAAAAEASNLAAAEDAAKAAEAAAQTAKDAASAAEAARQAAAAQAAAQAAQEAAEHAAAVAEQAKLDAVKAQKAAEEAANSSASDKEAAENAKKEAAAAQAAAEKAQASAENAAAAAEAARAAAAASNEAAAKSAAEAAASAEKAAKEYREIAAMKSQMVEYLHDAQKAKEEAEAARKAAEAAELACAKYYALYTLTHYADPDDYRATEQALLADAIDDAVSVINAAETADDVDAALADAKAVIDAIPTAEEMKLPFTDVKEGDWFENAVRYVYRNGLFNGTSATTFGPRQNMTRAQMVAVLYRLAGEPEVKTDVTFTDVKADAYYAKAVAWGAESGVITGVVEGVFAPDAPVTRAQAAAMLFRMAGSEKVEEDHLEGFADVKDVPAYAVDAMNWAVANEILTGALAGDDLILAADRQINRAEVAAILMRIAPQA